MKPTKEEIKEYMKLYNADEVGIDNPINLEEAEYQLLNSDKYYYQNKITDTLKIVIFESSNEPGYIYDIYNSEDEEAESLDGGICTGSMKDALDMATDQTKDLINK